MVPPHLAVELRELLENFFSELPCSDDALRGFLFPLVSKYCARHAPTMPVDLREDVLQETSLVLIGSGQGSYDGSSDTSAGYIYNAVRTALQSVRRRSGWAKSQRATAEEVPDLDALPHNAATTRREDARILAYEVLAVAGPSFGALLWKVYAEGESQEVALAGSGLSRFAFDRRRRAVLKSLSALGRCA
jgi:hypothetical protein